MALLSLMKRALGLGPTSQRPATRLTEVEALAIAREAIGRDAPLRVGDITASPAGLEWSIVETALGSGALVQIDDATGRVTKVGRWGVR